MLIKDLDVVLLKDGREGTILEMFDEGKAYMIEITNSEGKTVDTPVIEAEEIEKVIYSV